MGEFSPHQPDVFTHYFKLFYSKVNDTGTQFHDLLVKNANPGLNFQFRTAAQEFRMIPDQQQPVIVLYNQSEKWLQKLRFAGPTRGIMRALQRFTVNLHPHTVASMLADGRLTEVEPHKAPGIIAQSFPKLYDCRIGLTVYVNHLPVEDLIV